MRRLDQIAHAQLHLCNAARHQETVVQELSNILDLIPRPQSADAQEQATAIGFEDINTKDQAKPPKLQTFVFSATLTLPESLRKRLRKGAPLWCP